MREEPVVYINGLPFVLREQRRPLKNLQVHGGPVQPASQQYWVLRLLPWRTCVCVWGGG
jgi:hypothetical protein